MNWQAFFDPAFSGRLCLTLVHSLWQVALLAAAARGLELCWGRRRLERSYAAYVAALLAGLAAGPITYMLVAVGPPAESRRQIAEERSPTPDFEGRDSAVENRSPVSALDARRSTSGALQTAVADPISPEPAIIAAEGFSPRWLWVAPWLTTFYAAGVMVMLVRLAIGIWSAHRFAAQADLLRDGPLVDLLRTLAGKWSMRVVPALACAERIVVPRLVGLVRPLILLPASAITGLSLGELEMVLAHELAHVRRHDMWVNLLQRVAESVLFFNPTLWYLTRRMSLLREFCCDELTCRAMAQSGGDPRTRYAQALLRVVELNCAHDGVFDGSRVAALAASGRSPSELRRRIARLFGEPLREPLHLSRSGVLTITAFAALLLIGPLTWRSATDSAHSAEAAADEQEPIASNNNAEKANREYTFPITVFGRAVDEAGKTIANAEIYLAAGRPGYRRLAETKTAADGSYRFEKILLPIERADTNAGRNSGLFEVFGIAEGHALAWRPTKRFYPDRKHVFDSYFDPKSDHPLGYGTEDPVELDLTFSPPKTVRGRVVDDDGRPIAKTALAIRYCDTEWDQADYSISNFDGSLDCLNSQAIVPPRVKARSTDADGWFEFAGLPADYRWQIDVRPPGHPPRKIWAVTRGGIAADATGKRVYSGDFEVVFPRPRKVKLRVVYGDTGEPAHKVGLGGLVTEAAFWETTDAAGFIETSLPDGRYQLSVSPRYGSPYLRTEAELIVSAETVKEPPTFRLRPAAVVDITVIDAVTLQPLAGVDVWLDKEVPGSQTLYREVHGYRSCMLCPKAVKKVERLGQT